MVKNTPASASPHGGAPQLIGLDWGTSSLRAFLMRDGDLLETRQAPDGIQALAGAGVGGFERAFASISGDWLRRWPTLPVVACGMVGSAQGWREVPYLRGPVAVDALAGQGLTVASGSGPDVLIAPGVLFDPPDGLPEVMRGEETQVAGALLQHPRWRERARVVLPGTHSKWVEVEQARIVGLRTHLTGEMFAVLKAHTVLGRLMTTPDGAELTAIQRADQAGAFDLGLDTARASGPGELLSQVFAARTLGLTGRLPHHALASFLSGLLLGHELLAAVGREPRVGGSTVHCLLVGEPTLCAHYAHALRRFGHPADAVIDNCAPDGLWSLARSRGLLPA